MTPIPYLFFDGQAKAAFTHYGDVFEATPQIMTFGDLPPSEDDTMQMPADLVMHAAVQVGDGWIYGSDGDSTPMAGCNVHVEFETEAETRRVWAALSDGGEIRMPLEPSFWAPLFGACSDRFGIRWMVSQAGAAQTQ